MKLQEYFNQKKDHWLSDIEKMDVYYAIMDKNMKKSFQRKRSFLHVKSFVYTSFLFFFLVGFYGMYLFQWPSLDDSEGYILSRLANTNVVQADFVAKIVDFNGIFYIEQWGKTIQTSNIKDWDIVILKQNAQVIFHIDNDTKAKIIGPAKFVINKTAEMSYKVAMLYGEYVEVSSLQKENKHMIELAIDGLLVAQGENKKPLDFQLVKQGNGHVIKNNWAKLLVTSDDQKSTSVANKQVLSVQWNDISLFDSFDKFAKAVKEKDLSQTFTFVDTIKTQEESTNLDQEEEIKELDWEEILNIEEKDVPNIDLGLFDDQKVATPEQTKLIETQLNKRSLQDNIDQLVLSYNESNASVFNRSFGDLEKRISIIAKSFQYEYTSINWSEQEKIQSIISTIESLADHISNKFLLPPKYVESLRAIIPLLSPLKNLPFEKVSEVESDEIL